MAIGTDGAFVRAWLITVDETLHYSLSATHQLALFGLSPIKLRWNSI